jgi:polyhydroxybutyrate depolymerase
MTLNRRTLFVLMATFLACLSVTACMAHKNSDRNKQLGPGDHMLSLNVNGQERSYIVHVPRRTDTRAPLPVVFMLHGGGGNAKGTMQETGWSRKADQEGFLAVLPNALARNPARRSSFAFNPQLWNDASDRFYPNQKVVDDVAFIDALLDDLATRFPVDPRRIFVTGFSNGASMSFLLGAKLPHRIAAIAPVAGALWLEPGVLQPPVPMFYMTGTEDPLNIIEGGVPKLLSGGSDKVRAKSKPPVRESVVKWAKALGCAAEPVRKTSTNGIHTETYCSTGNGVEVVYMAVDGLGHTWAGAKRQLPESMVGKTTDKIKATDVIWDFFQKHARDVTDKKVIQ